MARFSIPNLAAIRGKDDKLYSALKSVQDMGNTIADQSNASATDASQGAPSQPSKINVTEKDGWHDVEIHDESPSYRAKDYFLRYSTSSDFSNSHQVHIGASQNHRVYMGPGKFYWKATSSYPTSDHSGWIFHGDNQPQAVGSGTMAGPPLSTDRSTDAYGPIYRNSDTPPVRQ